MTDTNSFGQEKNSALDESLSFQAASPKSIFTEGSVHPEICGRAFTPARGSDLTLNRPSLSSYPKFGHVKLLKRSTLLPNTPSRSPRHKSNMRTQIKRSRTSSSNIISRLEASTSYYSPKRTTLDSLVTDEENSLGTNATNNSLKTTIFLS